MKLVMGPSTRYSHTREYSRYFLLLDTRIFEIVEYLPILDTRNNTREYSRVGKI